MKNKNMIDLDTIKNMFDKTPRADFEIQTLANIIDGNISVHQINDLRKWVIDRFNCSTKDFDKALWKAKILNRYGKIPSTARELVECYVEYHNIAINLRGILSKPDRSLVKSPYSVEDLLYGVKHEDEELKINIRTSNIPDAISMWAKHQKSKMVDEIWKLIDGEVWEFSDNSWRSMISSIVDSQEVSVELGVASIKKFIWQVKRKMLGMDVTGHLMPVFTGEQGNGKSTFIRKLLSPISGLDRCVNFDEITDNRNIELWSNYVLFSDEMEKASRADVEAVKNVITADTRTVRILGTNNTSTVPQCATLIGATNSTLGAAIRDTTGLRRFAPLPTLKRPGSSGRTVDWDAINNIDFVQVWRSVRATDPDPMLNFQSDLAALQEGERQKSSVEHWYNDFNINNVRMDMTDKNRWMTANRLFSEFRQYEAEFFPSHFKTDLVAWGKEMTRLLGDDGNTKFEKSRNSKGCVYRYVGADSLVDQCDLNDVKSILISVR